MKAVFNKLWTPSQTTGSWNYVLTKINPLVNMKMFTYFELCHTKIHDMMRMCESEIKHESH